MFTLTTVAHVPSLHDTYLRYKATSRHICHSIQQMRLCAIFVVRCTSNSIEQSEN